MGFQQPGRLWGITEYGVLDLTVYSRTESDLNRGQRSSKERPSQGSAAAVVMFTDFTGWKGQRGGGFG